MGRSRKSKKHKSDASPVLETKFIFDKKDQIGSAGAEDDQEFLESCFVDTGYLDIIQDINDHRQIILGRTGIGKSAILSQLKKIQGDHVIDISPQDLALKYLANSTILQFLTTLDVNLDPFYKLLWRHVIAVEVLNRHFELHPELLQPKRDTWAYLKTLFSGNSRRAKKIRQSIEYLESWGEKFWEETELGVKEITTTMESQLNEDINAKLGINLAELAANISNQSSITDETRQQLVQRGQSIISRSQVEDLANVVPLIDELLDDRQKRYWIVIDDLDEDWVEEKLRYRLIMTLIQTSREITRVNNAKTCIAIRRDLIERVFSMTRKSGFQEDKYSSLYLPVQWSEQDLIKVLDKRVNALGLKKTGKDNIHIVDVLPRKVGSKNVKDYITEISTRPREVISLFNCCIKQGVGKSKLSLEDFRAAVGEYSKQRLKALADEWDATYPRLLDFTKLFSRKSESFKVNTIDIDLFKEICLNRVTGRQDTSDELSIIASEVAYEKTNPDYSLYRLMFIFYKTGFLGIKQTPHEPESWIDETGSGLSSNEINDETSVVIHNTYHRALGIH